jgi:Carboxypeptidase regulatory-like domain
MFDRWRRGASCAVVGESGTRLLVILLVFASVLRSASGQTAVDGAIRGVGIDEAAAAVTGAVVRAEDTSRGLVFTASCGAHGDFLLARLPAGVYSVRISAPGFATLALGRVRVEAGGTAELEMRLKVAGVRSVVTVTDDADEGTAGVEQPSGAAISSVIGTSEMDSLPINGQRWQSFALLTPAANAGEQGDGLLSFRGLAVTQNSTTVDGMDDDQSFNAVARGAESASDGASDGESEEETGVEPGAARARGGARERRTPSRSRRCVSFA